MKRVTYMTRKLMTFATVTGAALAISAAAASGGAPQADGSGKKVGDWPMWGGSPDRNQVSDETGIADNWDVRYDRVVIR